MDSVETEKAPVPPPRRSGKGGGGGKSAKSNSVAAERMKERAARRRRTREDEEDGTEDEGGGEGGGEGGRGRRGKGEESATTSSRMKTTRARMMRKAEDMRRREASVKKTAPPPLSESDANGDAGNEESVTSPPPRRRPPEQQRGSGRESQRRSGAEAGANGHRRSGRRPTTADHPLRGSGKKAPPPPARRSAPPSSGGAPLSQRRGGRGDEAARARDGGDSGRGVPSSSAGQTRGTGPRSSASARQSTGRRRPPPPAPSLPLQEQQSQRRGGRGERSSRNAVRVGSGRSREDEAVDRESSGRRADAVAPSREKTREDKMREKLAMNTGGSGREVVASSLAGEEKRRGDLSRESSGQQSEAAPTQEKTREEKMREKLAQNAVGSKRENVVSALASEEQRQENVVQESSGRQSGASPPQEKTRESSGRQTDSAPPRQKTREEKMREKLAQNAVVSKGEHVTSALATEEQRREDTVRESSDRQTDVAPPRQEKTREEKMREKLAQNAASSGREDGASGSVDEERKREDVAPKSSGRQTDSAPSREKTREEKMREKLAQNDVTSRSEVVASALAAEEGRREDVARESSDRQSGASPPRRGRTREEKMREKLKQNAGGSRREDMVSSLASEGRRREDLARKPSGRQTDASPPRREKTREEKMREKLKQNAAGSSRREFVARESSGNPSDDENDSGATGVKVEGGRRRGGTRDVVRASAAMDPTLWNDDADHIEKAEMSPDELAKAREKEQRTLLKLHSGIRASNVGYGSGGLVAMISGKNMNDSLRFARGNEAEEEKVACSEGDDSDGEGSSALPMTTLGRVSSTLAEKRGMWAVRDGTGHNSQSPGAYAMPGVNSSVHEPSLSEDDGEWEALPPQLVANTTSSSLSPLPRDDSTRTASPQPPAATLNRDESHHSAIQEAEVETAAQVDETLVAQLAPNEVDGGAVAAAEVALVSQEDDDVRLGRKLSRRDKIWLGVFLGLVIAGLGIGLGVGLTQGGSSGGTIYVVEEVATCEFRSPWRRLGPSVEHAVLYGNVVLVSEANIDDVVTRAFGSDVSLSDDGERLAVATRLGDVFSVFQFDEAAAGWTQLGEDIATDEVIELDSVYEAYTPGAAVLSGDGNRVAVGFPYFNRAHNGEVIARTGKVGVYEFADGKWSIVGDSLFGPEKSYYGQKNSVSLSEDGSVIAIGDYLYGNLRGRIQIFRLISGSWSQIGVDIVGENVGDQFGASVSLNEDGTVVAAGAIEHDSATGIARVFRFAPDSSNIFKNSGSWLQMGDALRGGPGYCVFGWPLSLSQNASRIAVTSTSFLGDGADCNDSDFIENNDVGEVRVYEYVPTRKVWAQMGLGFSGNEPSSQFGWSMSLSGDGSTLAIGAAGSESSGNMNSGYSRMFRYECGNWTQAGTDIGGSSTWEKLGFSVDLSRDGQKLAVGAPTDYTRAAAKSGTVTVFSHNFNVS